MCNRSEKPSPTPVWIDKREELGKKQKKSKKIIKKRLFLENFDPEKPKKNWNHIEYNPRLGGGDVDDEEEGGVCMCVVYVGDMYRKAYWVMAFHQKKMN